MSLSLSTQSHLISGMGTNASGAELISAIQNSVALSPLSYISLQDAMGENDVAANFQSAILGVYSLSPRDVQFVKDAFTLNVQDLANLIANLEGGMQRSIQLPNMIPVNVTMPAGFSFTINNVGPAMQQFEALTFPAGSAFASTGPGKYFEITTGGNTNEYYIWYNVSGGSNTDPAPAGYIGIEVTIGSGYTAAQVATATQLAISATMSPVGGFAVLGAAGVTNVGSSVLTGDLGSYPTASITGFPPGTYTGSLHDADGVAAAAQTAAQASFTSKQTLGLAGTTIAAELGGQTLTPGNYQSATSFGLSLTSGHSTLTFNGAGQYIIYSPSTLLTGASGSTDVPTMAFTGGATPSNTTIYWIVGSSATINQSVASAGATFYGNVIAEASITVTQNATVNGGLIALTGAVTLSASANVVAPSTGPETPVMLSATSTVSGSVVTVALTPIYVQVSSPGFTPVQGTYGSTQTVTIFCGTPGATIYYTTNGTTPTINSTRYTAPITVSSSQTVKAIATKSGEATSQVASAQYVIT